MPREYDDVYLGMDCVPMPEIPLSESHHPSPHEIVPSMSNDNVNVLS